MWAVGCVFVELLGRKVLFEAQKPSLQLFGWHDGPL